MPTASLRFEAQFQAAGYSGIVGMDEAGRGAWAGPVVAAAVALGAHLLKARRQLSGLRDSKMMTAAAREELAKQIQELSRAFGIGSASAREVDGCGLLPATRMAMARALAALRERGVGMRVDCLLVDSFVLPEERQLLQVSLLKGDQRSLSIAAASVLAKTWRDAWMVQQAERFPQYGFSQHKGYGTPQHRTALERYGPCALHRLSYQPIRALRS
ncbi:MAG: ribonuclease HII [Anaerolineaceae bacterium]|nr:ribonuclease HII [Anaerolineaceae bacterium]